MVDLTLSPAVTLMEATRALTADKPLESGDPRYEDLAPARGSDPLKKLERLYLGKQPGRFVHAAFLSHRGSGKTTELHRLQKKLSERYCSVYFEANVEMDANSLDTEDLLLVLARQVDREMRRLGHPLDDALLEEVGRWFAEELKTTDVGRDYVAAVETEIKAGSTTSLFGGLMGRITALNRFESKHREAVKEVLRKYPGTLLDLTNKLLEAAHQTLKTFEKRELLVVIDNMDRYDPMVMDHLLLRQGDRFAQLKCNLVITPPILLAYRPESGDLEQSFYPYVMPAVQLRKKEDPYDSTSGPGAPLLLKALGRRVDLDRVFPDDALRRRLLVASGGSIRDLLKIALEAVLEADHDKVGLADVEKAVSLRKGKMRNLINASGWAPVLSEIASTKQITKDDACHKVLHHRLAFEYNGETWHDIHPLVAELPEFSGLRKQ